MAGIKLYGARGGSLLRPLWMFAEAGVPFELVPKKK